LGVEGKTSGFALKERARSGGFPLKERVGPGEVQRAMRTNPSFSARKLLDGICCVTARGFVELN